MFLHKIKKIIFLFIFLYSSILSAEIIGRVMKANGQVLIKPIGGSSYSVEVKPGQSVSNGDAIRVGEGSFAVVIFLDDKSVVKVRENTDFQFVETSNTRSLIIDQGTTLHNVNKEGRQKAYRVETPVSVASVKGTEFSAFHDAVAGIDKFVGKTGNFDVFNTISGMTVNVGAGQKAVSNALGQLIPAPAQPGDFPDDPDGESNDQPEEDQPEEDQPEEDQPEEDQPEEDQPEEQEQLQDETQDEDLSEDQLNPENADSNQSQSGDSPKTKPKKPLNLGLGVGSATIDGKLYNQVALRPELSFGKLGLGLDLPIYIDNEGNIRKDEWDEFSDIIDKFLFIRWGEKSDPFWFKWGSLNNVTLGYGGLLNGYSNMMEFPSVRKVGVNTGFGFGNFGTEIFLSDIKDLSSRGGTLMGLRGTYKVSDSLPITLGVNFVSDLNQFSGLKDSDNDSYPDMFDDFPDNKELWNDTDGDGLPDNDPNRSAPLGGWDIDSNGDNVLDADQNPEDVILKQTPFSLNKNKATATGFALDVGYPVVKSKAFSLEVYAEFNSLTFDKVSSKTFNREDMTGTGITVPGIKSNLFGFLNMSFEYRIKKGFFVPQFFDGSYDLSRIVVETNELGTFIKTKDQFIFADSSTSANTSGMFGSASANLFNLLTFNASYASMKADTTEFNSFSALINLNAENIPKLSVAQAYYQRNNDKNPFDFSNPSQNTIFGYKVGYEVSEGVSLIWDFRQFYRDTGSGLEPVKQTTIETAFNF
jgi:hypothetical protein